MLLITKKAQNYFVGLLSQYKVSGVMIRILVTNGGTVFAKCGLCFCYPHSFKSSDVVIDFDHISVRVEKSMLSFLKDAVIDVAVQGLNFQVTFKAPYAKGVFGVDGDGVQENLDNVSLKKGIQDLLELQINPQLSMHGGSVSLVSVTEDFFVFLKFSGGCNGCAMANRTMQQGIEMVLKKAFPQLKGVRDVTEHDPGVHSYY